MNKEQKEQLKELLNVLRNTIDDENIPKEISDFMEKPYLQIEVSRSNMNMHIEHVYTSEIENTIPDVIAGLLDLVPEYKRNDILVEAISNTTSKKGKLYESNK